MGKKVFAIFVAGGSGTRMGSDIPKQFIKIAGRPILQHTILRFIDAIPDLNIIVVLPKQHFSTWKALCVEHPFVYQQTLVEGGLTRFHSVQNALEKVPDDAIVMVHDGVRPFVSATLLREMVERAQSVPALIPVVPVTDTLKTKDGSPAPDRSNLLAAQTPQVFHSEVLKQSYRLGYKLSFTDDASVAAENNIPLTYVDGERYNIKITTPEDLRIAELLLA